MCGYHIRICQHTRGPQTCLLSTLSVTLHLEYIVKPKPKSHSPSEVPKRGNWARVNARITKHNLQVLLNVDKVSLVLLLLCRIIFQLKCSCKPGLNSIDWKSSLTGCCLTAGDWPSSEYWNTIWQNPSRPGGTGTGCSYLKTDTRPSDSCPCHPSFNAGLQNTRGGECSLCLRWPVSGGQWGLDLLSDCQDTLRFVQDWRDEGIVWGGWSHYPLFVTGREHGITQYLPCGSRVRGGVTW